jgi:pimeloyl-ACP methyl ester carboxylesterase
MASSLILGANTILASQIAAGLLASTQQLITWMLEDLDPRIIEEVLNVVQESLSRIPDDHKPELNNSWKERLKLVQRQAGHEGNIKAEEVWLFGGANKLPGLTGKNFGADSLRFSFSLLATTEVRVLNYVGSIYDYSRENPARDGVLQLSDEERLVSSFCAEHNIRARFFLTSWLVGAHCVAHDSGQGIDRLLHALDELTAEIQERSPEYFDFQVLRIYASENATVNLVHMYHAVQLMLQISVAEEISDTPCCIVSAVETSWTDLCGLLGEIYGLSVLSVHNQEELNVIDHLLCDQWGGEEVAWAGQKAVRYRDGNAPAELQIDRETLAAFLSSIHQKLVKIRVARDERVLVLPGTMQKKTIPRNGSDLTYYIAGTQGEYIVVLNALGQPIDYWYRLIDVLIKSYHIIIWETRWLTSGSEFLRLSDQIDDIETIVRQEKIESCHLVGWCTGPQTAIEFYLRQPDPILDMVFLSCGFGITDHPELETPYSRYMETLCRAMIENPVITSTIQRSLSVPLASGARLGDSDAKARAVQVLSLTNIHLRNSVLAPFRTDTSTFNYAQQLIDLASYRTLDHAARVHVPVLIIGCEYDQVAAAAKSKVVARLFTTSRHVELPGATHYSFYDRSEQVAGIIKCFFKESQAIACRKDAAVGVGQ